MYMGAPKLKAKLQAQGGIHDVGALIGSIGRRKYSGKAMAHASALGRKKGHGAAEAYMKGLHGGK